MKAFKSSLDLLIVNAPGKRRVYQSLADELAAYEPPIWGGLIANYIRNKGFSVQVLDAEALRLSVEETAFQIADIKPLLTVFVVYGQQPSASTQCMPAAGETCRLLKEHSPFLKTLFMGTHPSALPERTLREEKTDFVCEGEGPHTILHILEALKAKSENYSDIGGLWFWKDGKPSTSGPDKNIKELDTELPGMAWDLLPMDKYRAHNWHCWSHIHERTPYASLYTSLGCPYRCTFCCINAPFGGSGIRYFSPQSIIKEIDILVNQYSIKNIKIADEMFVLNPKHVMGLSDLIIERGYKLNIWAYARVDTIREPFLEKMRKAGFTWFGIGIESGSKHVRDGVEKGRFGEEEITAIVDKVRAFDINVGANYIFGLPDDTLESMQQTLNLAMALNTEWANFYSAMAYPGSPLHKIATRDGITLPESEGGDGWIGYSQHAFETFPLSTASVLGGQVLAFRDMAFNKYMTNPNYLKMIENKFGIEAVQHIRQMNSYQLKRKYASLI